MYNYGKCHVCGEIMREGRINQDFWIKRRLVVIEDIPAGICPKCGEKVVKGDVGESIAALLEDSRRLRASRKIMVPVVRLVKESA